MTARKGPRLGRLIAAEKRINTTDGEGIIRRWRWAKAALDDPEITTHKGTLRRGRGIVERYIAEATSRGQRLSEREMQYRLQAGRTYPTEALCRSAAARYGSWRELCDEGIPPAAAPGEPAQLAIVGEDGEIEPGAVVTEDGDPVQLMITLDVAGLDRPVQVDGRLTISRYRARLVEWRERHQRHGDSLDRHDQAADLLLAAAGGDDAVTVADAAARLREMGGGSGPPALPPA